MVYSDFHLVSEHPTPLYLGPLPERWSRVPARVVVNLCGVMPAGESQLGRVTLLMPLLDVEEEEFMPARADLETFLDSAHAHAVREPTYWHCHAGLNRSGLAVAAYLHRHRGMKIGEAIRTLRERRDAMVLSNSLFERRLLEWYGDPEERSAAGQGARRP